MNSQLVVYAGVGLAALVVLLIGLLAARKRPHKLNCTYYQEHWLALQGQLRDKNTWSMAVIDADKLLDHALKTRRYKGKTMGERLVAAQRDIQNNDNVWFGHKLRNRLVHEQDVSLKQREVKDALVGIRSALKDLGAL